jgi:hypothetical protein
MSGQAHVTKLIRNEGDRRTRGLEGPTKHEPSQLHRALLGL